MDTVTDIKIQHNIEGTNKKYSATPGLGSLSFERDVDIFQFIMQTSKPKRENKNR